MTVGHVLFVCTANRCRSPMAEALAARGSRDRGLPLVMASCGLLAGGEPIVEEAEATLHDRGIDVDHTSVQIDESLLAQADVILTMERRHLLAVSDTLPSAAERAFTLVELVELAEPRLPDESVRAWAERCDALRPANSALSISTDQDVADPMGRSKRRFRRCADQLTRLIDRFLDLVEAPDEA